MSGERASRRGVFSKLIEAVIFDMDGLLLDSEPFWKEAEIEVFNSLGVPLTADMCDTTVGKRIEEVTIHWFGLYPWDTAKPGGTLDEVNSRVIDKVISLINERGEPFEGVEYIINFFKAKGLRLALASSSAMSIINAVMDKFKLRNEFEVIHSAEFEKAGKPDPAIYISTAAAMKVDPANCLAFEDSYNGLLAAKNAGMKTVVIPEPRNYDDSRFDIADVKLRSLTDFTESIYKSLC